MGVLEKGFWIPEIAAVFLAVGVIVEYLENYHQMKWQMHLLKVQRK